MPPKKAPVNDKQKKKIVEDKTFGMKNKGGKKAQQVVHQIQSSYQGQRKPDEQKKKKEEKEEEKAMLNELFKPVVQTVKKGEDPGSVLCAFFKKGTCGKGDKCKFSHDLNVERKAAKINLYEDQRDKEKDTMETWDQDKLEKVVTEKHGKEKIHPTTDIVCKYFLQAVEDSKYGWFWTCPNGGDSCMYRHKLPEGYILKKDKKAMEEQAEKISIEDLVERERAALGSNTTKVTLESFLAWKQKKLAEKRKNLAIENKRKKKAMMEGKTSNVTGRDIFNFRPELATQDDAEAADATSYEREFDNKEDGEAEAAEGAVAEPLVAFDASVFASADLLGDVEVPDEEVEAAEKMYEASQAAKAKAAEAKAAAAAASGASGGAQVHVDESLFEDLGDLSVEDS